MLRRMLTTGMAVVLLLPASAVPVAAEGSADFEALVDEIGRTMLARYPEEVTDLGLSAELGLDDRRLDDLSPAYLAETARLAGEGLDRLDLVDTDTLAPDQRITHAITKWYLEDIVTMAGYADHEYAVNFITGAHVNFPEFMADVHPLEDIDDAQAYVARLGAAGDQMEQVAGHFMRAEEEGNLPTRRGVEIAAWQIGRQIDAPETHALVTDLETRLASLSLSGPERERTISAARDAVRSSVMPAYVDLLELVDGAAARSDEQPGALFHTDGIDYYEAALRHHTTTSMTPGEVHQVGLREVERVRAELTEALGTAGFDVEALGFTGAVEAARAATPSIPLRSDQDREALLEATEAFIADTQDTFAPMFPTMPASAIGVQRPRPGRESAAGAYYRPPSVSGERPGIYYLGLAGDAFEMNTYATTNYHEAVPGHHFQIALQRESEDLPLIQRAATFTGFAEGWALYAERLAYEAGLYEDDPLGDIGRLRMELLRAARAVVDTGIHALGWSRSEAIDYLVELGFPSGWAANEIDRYIVWPGQAPAYLVGMLEILRLRAQAQSALGPDFDLATFHGAVLRHGSVPLEVLELAVADYVGGA